MTRSPKKTAPRNDLTATYVRTILKYFPRKGLLIWKENRRPRAKKGKPAGFQRNDGYTSVGIDGNQYLGHRLAWLIMTGDWPPEQIDHRFGVPRDLRWKSIRAATTSQNAYNKSIQTNNKSGIKGVHKHSCDNRWSTMITRKYKTHYLGLFKTPEEAAAAYKKAAKRLHGKFARF